MIMKVRVLHVGAVALLLTGVCLWPRTRSEEAVMSVPQAEPAVELSSLRSRLQALETQVRGLAERCKAAAPASSIAAQASYVPAEHALASSPTGTLPPTAPEHQPDQGNTLAQEFARKRDSESVDQSAGQSAARALSEQLAKSSPQTHLESVECTTSLCRFVLEHDTEAAQRDVDGSLASLELIRAGVAYEYLDGADGTITIGYALRTP